MKKNFVENSSSLIDAINAIISLHRCSFSAEDLELLEGCVYKLKQIGSIETESGKCELFVEVVLLLDKFFCSDNLQRFFDCFC